MKLAVLFSLLFLCIVARQNAAQASALSLNPTVSATTVETGAGKSFPATDLRKKANDSDDLSGFNAIDDDDDEEEGFLKKSFEQQHCFVLLSCIFLLHESATGATASLPAADDLEGASTARYITQRVLRI